MQTTRAAILAGANRPKVHELVRWIGAGVLAVLAVPALGAPGSAQPAPATTPPGASAAQLDVKATLAAATASLRKINTATGRFSQVAPDGSVTVGTFHLRRPGRMRFAYDAPTPILIVADGSTVAVEDKALETIDRVPLSSTPLGLFLKRDPDLARDAEVVSVQSGAGQIAIRLRDKSGETEGELILVFAEKSFALQEWMVIDGQGGLTRTTLSNVALNKRLDPRLFILRDKPL